MPRRTWTAAERTLVRQYAREGLSLARTAEVMRTLHRRANITRRSLGAFASRNGIRFDGECGAPFGNTNRTGRRRVERTIEELRAQSRDRQRRHRERVRL